MDYWTIQTFVDLAGFIGVAFLARLSVGGQWGAAVRSTFGTPAELWQTMSAIVVGFLVTWIMGIHGLLLAIVADLLPLMTVAGAVTVVSQMLLAKRSEVAAFFLTWLAWVVVFALWWSLNMPHVVIHDLFLVLAMVVLTIQMEYCRDPSILPEWLLKFLDHERDSEPAPSAGSSAAK